MKKLLIQLGIVFSCAILFWGCSNEGSAPAQAETDAFFDPLPRGLPVFIEIDEPFVADSGSDSDQTEGNGRSAFFSYQRPESATGLGETKEIISADRRLMVSLNTVHDEVGRSEVTLLARNDSVYSINHLTNQIRLLSHFTSTICELIPKEIVDVGEVPVPGQSNNKKVLTVLHDQLIYVMTAEAKGDASSACIGEGKKRFYALPLDHQLDPAQDEDGELNRLELVNESLARSKLIFGWVADTDQDDATQQKLTYGFLGYGVEEVSSPTLKPALVYYDNSRQEVWRQDRNIEKVPVIEIVPDVYSQPNLFHVQALENQHYLIQLGLDLFVVDSGAALISKTFDQVANILSDRSLRLAPKLSTEPTPREYAMPVMAYYDDDDLLIEDQGKIFSYAYQAKTPARNPSESYQDVQIIPQNPTNISSRAFATTRQFSQFDLKACGDDLNCQIAHDAEALSWQFLTPCTDTLGCSLNNQVGDFCETFEEKLSSQSDEPLCTASDYRHLSELNKPSNDMNFKAYMQYRDYLRDVRLALENNQLYITAHMNEKDLLLRYNYALDFSAPKSLREQVLFGGSSNLFGLIADFISSNLFMTVLTEGSVRSNECYKDYRRVECDLVEASQAGGLDVCTAFDLKEGACTSRFQEYESRALFCTQAQLIDGSCLDTGLAQIEELSVETAEQDAKWLKLYDYTADAANSYQMRLLVGDHTEALDEAMLDEGRLLNPKVYGFDLSTRSPLGSFGEVQGTVEQAVLGWIVRDAEATAEDDVEVLSHMQLISEDIISDSSPLQSELVSYLIQQSLISTDSGIEKVNHVQELGVSRYERP